MCDVCCKEFRGWCTSFTRTERFLTLLEVILALVLIAFLAFLILHLLVCPKQEVTYKYEVTTGTSVPYQETDGTSKLDENDVTAKTSIPYRDIDETFKADEDTSESNKPPTTGRGGEDSGKLTAGEISVSYTEAYVSTTRQTLASDVECTWKPSQKTRATTHYFEPGVPAAYVSAMREEFKLTTNAVLNSINSKSFENAGVEESDGEEPDFGFDSYVIALVKINPMRDTTFGCILTIVSKYWTLTAASCIESIEEMDSLDSFVMLEGYGAGAGAGAAHELADVRVHPLYGGANTTYDLAAIKSEDALKSGPGGFVELPTMMDYLFLTIGERLTILGYGKFRTTSTGASDRSVHKMHVYSLPSRACDAEEEGEGEEAWALRHLARAQALPQGACAAGGACAGPLLRVPACGWCAGTPLLRARRLLGVLAAGRACGEACAPARYVNVAALRDWIDAVLESD